MNKVRVMPVLLLRQRGLEKGVKFRDFKYVGCPVNAARVFNRHNVDELVLLDTCATPEGRGPVIDIVREIARESFMPFTVGGGIRSVDAALDMLAAGAENIPLCSDYADMAYARFAYFFGTSACLSGLAEVMRVLKPGGNFFIVDVIPEWGTWGTVARKAYPSVFHPNYHADQSRFYASHGFATHRVETVFRAPDRETMKTVFQMDFPKAWEELLQDVRSLELSYGIAVFHQQKH